MKSRFQDQDQDHTKLQIEQQRRSVTERLRDWSPDRSVVEWLKDSEKQAEWQNDRVAEGQELRV